MNPGTVPGALFETVPGAVAGTAPGALLGAVHRATPDAGRVPAPTRAPAPGPTPAPPPAPAPAPDAPDRAPAGPPGHVALVGAGPGDPGLLTLRGRELLERADLVVYDRLAEPVLAAWCPPAAARVDAGKGRGRPGLAQEAINRLLIAEARAGRRVVRLKGGDPFVFGRGGEEAAALAAAGVPFEVVPGVSAAFAVPAAAGIPLTQRGLSSSLLVITGHERPPGPLACPADTLVVLMGSAHLAEIAAALIAGGRAAATPAAVVAHGWLPSQAVVAGPLAGIAQAAAAAGLPAPAVLVVGEVARLHRPRPRVLVTRAQDAAAVRRAGGWPALVPVLRAEAVPEAQRPALPDLAAYAWICFTSASGVRFFAERLPDLRRLGGARLAAVGEATAEALRALRLAVDLVPARATAADLAAALAEGLRPGQRVLCVRGEPASPDLPAGLRAAGATVDEAVVYRTATAPNAPVQARAAFSAGLDSLALASGATARLLVEAVPELRGVPAACIGPRTASAAAALGLRVAGVAARAGAAELGLAAVRVARGEGESGQGGERHGVS